jgi:hypothetical protein
LLAFATSSAAAAALSTSGWYNSADCQCQSDRKTARAIVT